MISAHLWKTIKGQEVTNKGSVLFTVFRPCVMAPLCRGAGKGRVQRTEPGWERSHWERAQSTTGIVKSGIMCWFKSIIKNDMIYSAFCPGITVKCGVKEFLHQVSPLRKSLILNWHNYEYKMVLVGQCSTVNITNAPRCSIEMALFSEG